MDGDGEPDQALLGYAILAAGVLDGLLALFFAFVRPPPDPRARRSLPLILGLAAAGVIGLGSAFLLGAFAKEG